MTITTSETHTTVTFSGNLMVDGHHLMGEVEAFMMSVEGDIVIDITAVTELGIQGATIVASMWKSAPYGATCNIVAPRCYAGLFRMIRLPVIVGCA